ncbi:MAG: hypothetical protein ABW221_21545 [Vicinamibacteria bacterium]
MAFSSPLIAAAARCSGADRRAVGAMARSLVEPAHRPAPGRAAPSILNNDGLPLQLCVSSRAERVSVRLIGDPCTGIADPMERVGRSIERLSAVLRWSGAQGLAQPARSTVEETLPADDSSRRALVHGGLWLAVDACGRPGIALYTTLDWGDERRTERWGRVRAWLRRLLRDDTQPTALLRSLALLGWPVSAGLEGSSAADAVAKVYLCLDHPQTPDRLGIDAFRDPQLTDFYERTLAGRPLPPTGVVLCVAFSLSTGQLASVKLDICGHCVPQAPEDWRDTVDLWAGRLGVRPLSVRPLLDGSPVEVAFIGLGSTGRSRYRLNLYLKAAAAAPA